MMDIPRPTTEEVDQLLLNAELRDALEPYWDEAVAIIDVDGMPTTVENQFLASMLAWERAPVVPISQWFDPELKLPSAALLDDAMLSDLLYQTIAKLYEKRIVLKRTEHLSDRQLYCLIQRDILPSLEKKVDRSNTLHWQCLNEEDDPETWLRFYATADERLRWALRTGQPLPPQSDPPFLRELPGADEGE